MLERMTSRRFLLLIRMSTSSLSFNWYRASRSFPFAYFFSFCFFLAEDGIRALIVTGVQTCALPISAALLDGRAYVLPDDVKQLAPAVLRHRVSVAPELELEGVTPDAALKAILDKTEVPTA